MNTPFTREDWLRYQHTTPLLGPTSAINRITDEDEVIRRNINWLIANLYEPNAEVGAWAGSRVDELGFSEEAINWGDLSCVMVEPPAEGGGWAALVEEASPDCPRFRAYIEGWLKRWGWDVEVETEW